MIYLTKIKSKTIFLFERVPIMGLSLWELILLVIILKIMLLTQTSYCDEYNINRNDCDYNSVGLKHFCFTIGYLFGKRYLNI